MNSKRTALTSLALSLLALTLGAAGCAADAAPEADVSEGALSGAGKASEGALAQEVVRFEGRLLGSVPAASPEVKLNVKRWDIFVGSAGISLVAVGLNDATAFRYTLLLRREANGDRNVRAQAVLADGTSPLLFTPRDVFDKIELDLGRMIGAGALPSSNTQCSMESAALLVNHLATKAMDGDPALQALPPAVGRAGQWSPVPKKLAPLIFSTFDLCIPR